MLRKKLALSWIVGEREKEWGAWQGVRAQENAGMRVGWACADKDEQALGEVIGPNNSAQLHDLLLNTHKNRNTCRS